jgi:molecular chaperone GrpE
MPKKSQQPVEDQLGEQDVQIEELTADLQRVQADFANFRRRSEEDRASFIDMAKQDVILRVLPLLDNIHRALMHAPEELKDNQWAQGVAQIGKQAEDSLKALGIERIETLGQPFDPHLHEAIAHDGEGETVIEELQPGYKIGNKVIRHAMVKVGKKEK